MPEMDRCASRVKASLHREDCVLWVPRFDGSPSLAPVDCVAIEDSAQELLRRILRMRRLMSLAYTLRHISIPRGLYEDKIVELDASQMRMRSLPGSKRSYVAVHSVHLSSDEVPHTLERSQLLVCIALADHREEPHRCVDRRGGFSDDGLSVQCGHRDPVLTSASEQRSPRELL